MPSSSAPWELLSRLRRRLRRLIWWSGVCQGLIALVVGLSVAGWIDWYWRLEDRGLRALLSLSVCISMSWVVWRTLLKPLRFPISDTFLTAQIDRQYPGYGSRLTAAAEFQSHNLDPRHGSRELQALVIQQAGGDLAGLDSEQLLKPRRLAPLFAGALVACALAVGLLWAFPLEAGTALRRLAAPWGSTPWPRNVVLQLRAANGQILEWNPRSGLQVVRNEALELTVENLRGPLPDDLRLQLREPGQEFPEESPIVGTGKRAHRKRGQNETAALTIPANRDSVEFRVIGGDDRHLPWYGLFAIDPPRLLQSEILVRPPTYLNEPPVRLPVGTTQIRGWLGSQVEIQARADRPISKIELRVGDRSVVHVPVGEDGLSWTAKLEIDQPGLTHFAFILRDSQGFARAHPLQFELRGQVDTIPDVIMQEPAGDLWVTPTATIPLRASARDDLGVTQFQKTWQRGDQPLVTDPLQVFDNPPEQAELSTDWELAPLNLQAGERLVLRIEARDACEIGEPHVGRSAPRALLVVTSDEKRRELTDRVAELVTELREGLEAQQRLKMQAGELQTQLETVGELQTTDRDLLNRLQSDQRRLASQLGDELRGLSRRAAQLRDEFPMNGLSDAEAEPQLDDLAQELRDLAATTFPAIDRELTQAIKLTESISNAEESALPSSRSSLQPLSRVRRLQQDAETVLKERHAELSHWQQDRHLGDDLQALKEHQEELNRETADLGAQTLSRSLAELAPQQRADLNKLADRQRQVGQQVEQLQRDFGELSKRLESREPERADDALEMMRQLQESQVAMRLRQSAEDIAANRLGNAGETQQQATQMLGQMAHDWSGARPDDTEQMLKRTEEADEMAKSLNDDLEEMRKRSEIQNLDQAGAAGRKDLEERALELRRRAQRLERALQRLQLNRGARRAREAAELLRRAQQSIQAGDEAASRQQLESASEEIEQLQSEISESRRKVQEQLAQEEIERVLGTIQSLKIRQDGVLAEIQRLESERVSAGRLSRGQLRSLQDLATTEQDLRELAESTSELLKTAVVAHAAMNSVARSLKQSAARLAERQTDAVTQMLAADAARRLERIIEAWNQQQASSENQAATPNESGEPSNEETSPQAGPPGEAISFMTQLHLLRALQVDCLTRTEALEKLRQPDGQWPAGLSGMLEDLALEQGSLVSLARQLAELSRKFQEEAGNKTSESQKAADSSAREAFP